MAERIVLEVIQLELVQFKPLIAWSSTAIVAVRVPQLSDIDAISLRYSLFLNSCFKRSLYFCGFWFKRAEALLLGGWLGASLKNMTSRIQGTVMTQASMKISLFTSSAVLVVSLIKYPGSEAPKVTESRLKSMPVKEAILTMSDLNQLIATLLGVFNTKILPMAARPDPIKQKMEFSSQIRSRSHTPPMVKTAPTIKLTRIPFLLMSQLQGKANSGCAIVNNSAFIVTYVELILKILSAATLMLEKVWTGIEFTNAAARYVRMTTNLYPSSRYQDLSMITIKIMSALIASSPLLWTNIISMNFNKRKEEEQNIICALHTLTDMCLRECYKAGQGHLMKQNDPCFSACARNMIEMRFKIKEKWMEDYSASQKRNNDIWNEFIDK